MARIIAIDYGKKRTGIAVTDPTKIIAQPLTTVDTSTLTGFLVDYLSKEKVEVILIGDPHDLLNRPAEIRREILNLVKKFILLFPSIPVKLIDERFTTAMAQQTVRSGGVKKKARMDKALYDKVSAAIILQSYLENPSMAYDPPIDK